MYPGLPRTTKILYQPALPYRYRQVTAGLGIVGAIVPEEAARVAGEIGLPVLVRPSYVLGGRAMVIAYDVNTVQEYVAQAAMMGPARPVLIDQFLEEATEVDVDALADGTDVVIGGIMDVSKKPG